MHNPCGSGQNGAADEKCTTRKPKHRAKLKINHRVDRAHHQMDLDGTADNASEAEQDQDSSGNGKCDLHSKPHVSERSDLRLFSDIFNS